MRQTINATDSSAVLDLFSDRLGVVLIVAANDTRAGYVLRLTADEARTAAEGLLAAATAAEQARRAA